MNVLRLLRPVSTPLCRLPFIITIEHLHTSTTQPGWFNWGSKSKDAPVDSSVPESRSITDMLKQSPKTASKAPSMPSPGDLTESSIFAEDEAAAADVAGHGRSYNELDLTHVRRRRDPYREQWGWPKRAAAREMRRRGRLSRTQRIAQTEKEHTVKSQFFKTSYKKLGQVARQIAGKKLEDAVTQMRFSPKKAARDVLAHLHHARDEAVVRQDMDPAQMYVAQAWVGRGSYELDILHRARGRIDTLRKPYAYITVQFKELVTLERIAREKRAKEMRKAPWQPLPSRPIYGQTQYYRW